MRFAFPFLAAFLLVAPAAHAQGVMPLSFDLAQVDGTRPVERSPDPSEILIVGQRLPGSARGDSPPLFRYDERDIASFGADRIGELVDALAPQAGSASGGRPAILVNGQRIASFAEVRELPAEAVLRVDILPEEAAQLYGYGPDRRVVNIVLRPRFRAVTAETAQGFSTGGGRRAWRAGLSVARIGEEGRWNLHARAEGAEALLESERRVEGGQGAFRTLLPRSAQLRLGGSFTRDVLPGVSATLTAGLEGGESRARIGPFAPGAGAPIRALRRDGEVRSANLGLSLGGERGRWHWLLSGSFDRGTSLQRTEVAAAAGVARERARTRTSFGEVQLFLSGPLASLPAGEVQASLRLDGLLHRISARSNAGGSTEQSRLSRGQGAAELSLEAPIFGSGTMGWVGSLSFNGRMKIATLSDFGTLAEWGGGFRWGPARWLSLAAAWSREDQAPAVHELGGARLTTPNLRVFDFVRGESADIDRLDGGNPALRAPRRRLQRLSLVLRPFRDREFSLTADYSRSRLADPIAILPAPTAEVEAAFPGRFARDADGRLLRIDARPVNFDRSERDLLRWGAVYARRLAASPSPAGAEGDPRLAALVGERDRSGRLQLAIFHTVHLRDRLRVVGGGPWLDFLRGAPGGGRPRHEIEFQGSYYRSGIGARLDGRWRGGMDVTVPAGTGAGSYRLDHSGLLRLDAAAFIDLGERLPARWARGVRLSLEVDNLLDSRLRVRDPDGAIPRAFQPAYLDPAGRTLRLSLRKLF